MSACQVESCSCRQSLPMRGNTSICIGHNHPVSVHLIQKDNDDIEIIPSWNGKKEYPYIIIIIID